MGNGRKPTAQESAAFQKQLADLNAQAEKFGFTLDKTAKATRSLTGSLGDFLSTGAKSTQRVHEISTAYDDMQNVLKSTTNVTDILTRTAGGLVEKLKFLGPVASGAGAAIKGIGKAFSLVAGGAMEVPKQLIQGLDEQTRGLRQFEAEMFNIHKRFGGTIDEAKDFSDTMRMASDNPLAKSLHLTTNEMAGFVRATERTSLTQKQLSETVQTGAGVIELFGAATAFAEASSMSYNEAAGLMNTLMNKQGKSAQEATNMLGMFVGVAEETGLAIDKVANSLNSAVGQFAKIGMAADFGKPIMEGFAKTMSDMGLGIEESIGLSQELTGALAGLTNNYGMAYLTFQRGGLDIGGGGGGGVLSSSIALQSAYLDAENSDDQGAIADQLVRGMRDTLASFTGGDIITVQEANRDQSLEKQFYMQQQLLKSNFGIRDDNSASRVLDMLSRLDEATRTGDAETQAKLKEQLEKEAKGRGSTLDEMEKVNRKLETQTNIMVVSLRNDLEQTRRMAAATGRGVMNYLPLGVKAAHKTMAAQGAALKRIADFLNLEKGSQPAEAWDKYKSEHFLQATDAPMNVINRAESNAAAIEMRKTGNLGDAGLLDILAGATVRGKPITNKQITAVADTMAELATKEGTETTATLAKQLAAEFTAALTNFKPDVNIVLSAGASELVKEHRDMAGALGPVGANP